MVSDSELIDRLREFLRNADLNTTTTAIVRRKLEADFEVDLSDKKWFIREQVDLFLQAEQERAAEDAGNSCEEPNHDDGDGNLKTEEADGENEDAEDGDDDDDKGEPR